ncbi:MAG TPA: hypothetical protein VEA59_04005 [Patescibacteria group bacterium]|nr:hypothetical protein [Patescibacteria group bacterium]
MKVYNTASILAGCNGLLVIGLASLTWGITNPRLLVCGLITMGSAGFIRLSDWIAAHSPRPKDVRIFLRFGLPFFALIVLSILDYSLGSPGKLWVRQFWGPIPTFMTLLCMVTMALHPPIFRKLRGARSR